ncbi:MAG: hypothetical protein U0P81_07310 [Holophagaceae bacterium]
MRALLARIFGGAPSPGLEPRFDEAVARRLEAAGKAPGRVQATPAAPLEIPARPPLPGFQGRVRFELTLDAAGKVSGVAMDQAPAAHRGTLEAWTRAWTFAPASLDGRPHPCRMVYEVHWD